MPNWCMNSVTITGTKEKLELLVEACKNDKLLETLNPIGEWDYGKACEAWGTKWEVRQVDWDIDYDNLELTLNFDSAWGPPTVAYAEGELLHNLEIRATYYEPGMMFVGMYEDREDQSYSIDFEDEDWEDNLPEDLIWDWGLREEYENWKEYQDEEE